tara:strand:- start:835 stop:1530 length:696 start_codon:yes stop_codon:yes gene_type:complete
MKNIIISLDGHSACGKSTLAKMISDHLSYVYIDTGAMYRAITLYFIKNNLIDQDNNLSKDFINHVDNIHIDFAKKSNEEKFTVRLNGVFVEKEIRTLEISKLVSSVSKNQIIRSKLIKLQQSYGAENNLVIDGRDIGTVVFPYAQIKFWITASEKIRAQRRYLEFQKTNSDITFKEVLEDIKRRDNEDENRTISPLIKPDNAMEIDNSYLSIEKTFQTALTHINEMMKDER